MGETMNLDHMMSVSFSCLPTFLLNSDRVLVHRLQHNEEVAPKTECHKVMQTSHHNEPLTWVASLPTTFTFTFTFRSLNIVVMNINQYHEHLLQPPRGLL